MCQGFACVLHVPIPRLDSLSSDSAETPPHPANSSVCRTSRNTDTSINRVFCEFASKMAWRGIGRQLHRGSVIYGMTHALRIPLATPTSRPQLQRSLRQVMLDPSASGIHPAAFASPDMQNLYIGTLSLQTSESMDKALKILQTLKLDDMLQECTRNIYPSKIDPIVPVMETQRPTNL